MNYTIFNATTGKIISNLSINDISLLQDNIQTDSYIEGHYSEQDYYIKDNLAVSKGPCPGECYEFDYNLKKWIINTNLLINLTRQQRNQLLIQVDRINPVWYAALTVDQQQALAAYRQQLLDVPQQAGFPIDVTWPAKPTWL